MKYILDNVSRTPAYEKRVQKRTTTNQWDLILKEVCKLTNARVSETQLEGRTKCVSECFQEQISHVNTLQGPRTAAISILPNTSAWRGAKLTTEIILYFTSSCRDSSVGKPTGYGQDDRMIGVRFPTEGGNFLFDTVSRPALGSTQPPIKWVPGTLSLEVKRPGREADHSPPSSAEVKNAWSYASTSHASPWLGA
jgi:hypothetical protein